MSSTLSPTQSDSAGRLPTEPSDDTTTHRPTVLRNELLPSKRSSIAPRAFARFLITFCIGVGATLAWKSHGDAAKERIASSFPQFSWLAPQTAPDTIAPAAPTPDQQQLEAMSLDLAAVRQSVNDLAAVRQSVNDLAAVRQSVDQLAAGQEQMTREITKLQVTEQYILDKMSTPPPRPAPTAARKPAPRPSQAPPERDVSSQRNPMGPLHGIW
jgi:hypothetical protein